MVDFIEVFNRGVKRGKYLAADRVLYLIPESDTNELVITTEENATLWGDRIKLGEIARMALPGRVAMSNPTIDEVNTTTLEYANKLIAHSNIMQDYIDAQLLVKGDCTEMDIVLEKVAGQLHTNYSELDAPTRRRYMRQYGVPFSSKISLTFNFLITNSITHTTVDGTVLLEETGLERVAIHGMAQMVSIVADEATFLITHPDFHNQEIVEDLTTGVTTFDINVALVPLI